MAADWIKMRVWLCRDPKVIRMADALAGDRSFMQWLTDPVRQSCEKSAYEHVTRNVTASLCITALLVTWGTAREQGDRDEDDLVLSHCDFSTLDAMADLPGFGVAMGSVGWAVERDDGALVFPKFFKDNESPDEKHKRQNAERQARLRERRRLEDEEKSNAIVTAKSNVTVTTEKRREEKSKELKPLSGKPDGMAVDKGQKTKTLNATAVRVLAHLNTTCGTKFESVEANLKFIRGRLAEYPEETLIRVVDAKRKEWTGTEQAKYLRPETLFGATKCAQYAGQLDVKPSEKPAGRELLEIEAESIDGQIRFLCTSHGEHFVAAKNALTKFFAQLNGSARNIIVKPSSGQPSKFSVEELRTA